ncbi:MAG: retropepsin-like aspartic protease [Candidatus Baltobacteraceae bacterium]
MAFAGRAFGLSVLAVFLTGAAPKPPSLHQLVVEMRAAAGDPYRYHITGTAHEKDNENDVSISADFSELQFLTRRCVGTLCTGTYFDGSHLFGVNMNDTALPAVGEPELKAVRFINSGMFLSPQFTHAGGVLRDMGMIRSEGTAYRAIAVNAPSAPPMYVLVNTQSFLVSGVRDFTGTVSFEDRDYRRVGPLMLPFLIYQNGVAVQKYDTRSISPTAFATPRGLQPRFRAPPSAIPILQAKDAPVIPCTLAGVQTRCLIDTGNSGVSMSKELAERLGLPAVGEFEVTGLGRYATEVVRAGPLDIGTAEFPAANYVVLHDIHPYGYDVVIGADVLANSVVTIDYAKRNVMLADHGEVADSTIALEFINFVPVVPVELGTTATLLAVDTGDESTINLSYDYYRQHTDLFHATESRSVTGVGGISIQLLGEIGLVRLGTYRVESQHIGTTQSLHATGQGHLGAGFLSHFRVVLDYARARLGLTPRSGDRAIEPASTAAP